MQARAESDLSKRTYRRAAELAINADLRMNPRNAKPVGMIAKSYGDFSAAASASWMSFARAVSMAFAPGAPAHL
jgi:hypothetical protein